MFHILRLRDSYDIENCDTHVSHWCLCTYPTLIAHIVQIAYFYLMRLTIGLILLLCGLQAAAQNVGVNTATPDPTAAFEIKSDNAGFLPPRLTSAQRDAIASPATGLVIYNTDNNCLEFWNATKWISTCATTAPCTPPLVGTATANSPLCSGETLNLSAGAIAGVTYVWSGPNGYSSNSQNPSIPNAQLTDSGTYTLRTWMLGCYSDPRTVEVDVLPNPWQKMATVFPGTLRSLSCGFRVGSKLYVGRGTVGCPGTHYSDFYSYHPPTNTWASLAAVPGVARYGSGGFAIGGKGYMVGGNSCATSTLYADLYAFDTLTGTWSGALATISTARTESMRICPQNDTMAFYGLGNFTASCGGTTFQAYRASNNTWTNKTNFPNGDRNHQHAMNFANQRVFLGGGSVFKCGSANYTDWNEYLPASNTWMAKAAFPQASIYCTFVIGDYGYAVAGNKTVWRYDPTANSWTQLSCNYPGTVSWGMGFGYGNVGYVIDTNTGDVYRYTPQP